MKEIKQVLPHPYWVDFSDLYRRSEDIAHAYQSNNLIFFIGSGVSKFYINEMPNWIQLLEALMAELPSQEKWQRAEIKHLIEKRAFLLAAEAIKHYAILTMANKNLAVDNVISKIINQRLRINRSNKDPMLHLAILDFAVPIVTTNFDTILEDFIRDCMIETYKPTPIEYSDENDVASLLIPGRKQRSYIFKLHGSIEKGQRLIFDEEDYSDFYFHRKWPVSLQFLRYLLATKMIVFIGFSLSDPEIMPILREATRYSVSYQHIALMRETDITSIEKEVLKSNYKVDPIIYKDQFHIPLFLLEMRNFFPRDHLPLHLRNESNRIMNAIAVINKHEIIDKNASVILFGSFVKYGYISKLEADIDILFLTMDIPFKPIVQIPKSDKILERRTDITIMTFTDFEKLLRAGDPFASSVLITGCPISDPVDRYGILARGFKGKYDYKEVINNAFDGYYLRWLRLCYSTKASLSDFLPAVYQWVITLIQLFILKDYYHLDLLRISLLGNPRYAIHDFSLRFDCDEKFYLDILLASKGILQNDQEKYYDIDQITKDFIRISSNKNYDDVYELLQPSSFLFNTTPELILDIYNILSNELNALERGENRIGLGYVSSDTEKSFLNKVHKTEINAYDYPFFFGFNQMIQMVDSNEKVNLCKKAQKIWKDSPGISFINSVKNIDNEN